MGARFLIALFASMLLSLAVLGGAGYAVSQLTVPAPREVVRTPSFEFELAPGWQCRREGAETSCYPTDKKPSAAVIIFAVKLRNKDDTLAAYRQHLETPQKRPDTDGSPGSLSTIRFVRQRELGGREWMEALHVDSELRNWETYYLATVTSFVAIVVTLSAHKDYTDRYIDQLRDMIKTLKTYER
jgi:hypothetical protein